MISPVSRPGHGLCAAALWLALSSCTPSGVDGTLLLLQLSPSGKPALADDDHLTVTVRYDAVHRKVIELPTPPPQRFALRTPPGYQGPVVVAVQRLDASGCQTGSARSATEVAGEDSIDLPLTLRLTACEDPVPAPANALPDLLLPGVPADVRARFGPKDTGTAPTAVYPFSGTYSAANLGPLRVQWTGSQSLYRVVLAGPGASQRIFTPCDNGKSCSVELSGALWSRLAGANRDQDLTITITGAADSDGALSIGQGSADPVRVRVLPADLRGGIYYFSPSTSGLKRVPIGARAPVDFLSQGGGTGCAGCHALSRDGRRVAVELGSADSNLGSTVFDAADQRRQLFPPSRDSAWNFATFNPEGDRLISVWQGALTLRDAATGQKIKDLPRDLVGGQGATMPEWSPDGKWLAVVRLQKASRDFALSDSGDLVILPYNSGAFGPAVTLARATPGGTVHAWPSWSPDSRSLVFSSQRCGGVPCDGYDARNTRLRLVRAIGDDGQPTAPPDPAPPALPDPAKMPTPLELTLATRAEAPGNNWPKFSPFVQTTADGRRLAFVVFNSRAAYGLQPEGPPQLFFFAVDLSAADKGGADPSAPPLWLPFQDAAAGNHSALWTTDVACAASGDCPDEFSCTAGVCVPGLG